jgi:hypothetical protein
MWYLQPVNERIKLESYHGADLITNSQIIWLGRPARKPQLFGRSQVQAAGLEGRCVSRAHCRFQEPSCCSVQGTQPALVLKVLIISRHGVRLYPLGRYATVRWLEPTEETSLSTGDVLSFGATGHGSKSLRFRLGFLSVTYSTDKGFFEGTAERMSWARLLNQWRWHSVRNAGQGMVRASGCVSLRVHFTEQLAAWRASASDKTTIRDQIDDTSQDLSISSAGGMHLVDQHFLLWFEEQLRRSGGAQRPFRLMSSEYSSVLNDATNTFDVRTQDAAQMPTRSAKRSMTCPAGLADKRMRLILSVPRPYQSTANDTLQRGIEVTAHPVAKDSIRISFPRMDDETSILDRPCNHCDADLTPQRSDFGAHPRSECMPAARGSHVSGQEVSAPSTRTQQRMQWTGAPEIHPNIRRNTEWSPGTQATASLGCQYASFDSRSKRSYSSLCDDQHLQSEARSDAVRSTTISIANGDHHSEGGNPKAQRWSFHRTFEHQASTSAQKQHRDGAPNIIPRPRTALIANQTSTGINEAAHVSLSSPDGAAGSDTNRSTNEASNGMTSAKNESIANTATAFHSSRAWQGQAFPVEWFPRQRVSLREVQATAFTILQKRTMIWQRPDRPLQARTSPDDKRWRRKSARVAIPSAAWYVTRPWPQTELQRACFTRISRRLAQWIC